MTITSEAAAVSDDASAILLLSATLGKRRRDAVAPLTIGEYDQLAESLRHHDLRPNNLLLADQSTLRSVADRLAGTRWKDVTAERMTRLLERGGQLALALSKWTSHGIWIVTRADSTYPARYKQKLGRAAPPVVFGIGPPSLLEKGGVAVVGSREPDPRSEDFTRHVGEWAALAGVQIVSGAARGVDEISMVSCASNGGTAVGVVGESLLRVSTRRDFRSHIVDGRMTLVSSYDPEAPFTVANAMGRNRWIYALASRALVVACSEGRGGTWAGAIEAMKRGVTVFVKTGNPDRPGNDALLRHGAESAPANLDDMLTDKGGEPTVSALVGDSDIFTLAVPAILARLRTPGTLKQLADDLQLTQAQAKAWLGRLVDDGTVVKSGTRFGLAPRESSKPDPAQQISLLPGA